MPGPITDALEHWKQGNDDAQFDLERALRPFLRDMLRFIRRHREALLIPRIDSEGVIYAALNSFLTGARKDEFPAMQNQEEVRKVLTTLIIRTLHDEIKWHTAQKRTPHREQPSENHDELFGATAKGQQAQAGSSPSELAGWLENFLNVMRRVHPNAIDIVTLRIEGLTNQEIKDELGLGLRRVQMIIQDMRMAWEEAAVREV